MKVKARFRHVIEVTRDVEIDDEDYARFVAHEEIRYRDTSDERLLPIYLDSQDGEYLADVFPDWKTSAPLPPDFELQYTEVADAERVPGSTERSQEDRRDAAHALRDLGREIDPDSTEQDHVHGWIQWGAHTVCNTCNARPESTEPESS